MGKVVLKKILGKKWEMYRIMKKAVALLISVVMIIVNINNEMIMGFAEDSAEAVVNIGDRFTVEGLEYEVIGDEEVAVIRLEDQNITDLVIPEKVAYDERKFGVTDIKIYAFDNCSSLTSIMIPDSIINVDGYDVFCRGCSNLQEINVSKNNLQYTSENGVLFDKNKSKLIRYPEGKKGEYEIPEGVTTIRYAFNNCDSLTSIVIPGSMIDMENYPFSGCSNLNEIKVSDENEEYTSEKGVLFNKDKTILIKFPAKKKGEYKIPKGVTFIGHIAFEDCSNLTDVVVPDSVMTIGDMAFCNCINLTSIIIPDSVTTISMYIEPYLIFHGCNNLTIYSTENSYAHSFALEYEIPWAPLTAIIPVTIKILEGKDMQYSGSGDYILRLDKESDKFIDVLMDGIPVDPANYTVTEGLTIIAFFENYLRTLQEGEHIIKVNFNNGYADTTLTILSSELQSNKELAISENNKVAAKTGDGIPHILLGVLFASAATVGIVYAKKRISN